MRQITSTPVKLIAFGFVLVLFGFCVVFGMVIRLIEPGFGLSFLSYASSVVGLVLGVIGIMQYNQSG